MLNKHQENKLSTYEGVLNILKDNEDKTSTVTGFSESVTELDSVVSKIKLKAAEKADATSGKTAAKYLAEDGLISALLPVSASLVILGRREKDMTLKEKATVTESGLRRMRDTELSTKANSIYELAASRATDLQARGVTAEKLTALKAKIETYDQTLSARESSVSERMGASQSLVDLFKEADSLLDEEVDGLMEHVRDDYPQFYNEYFAARMIKDAGTRHRPTEAAPTPPSAQK